MQKKKVNLCALLLMLIMLIVPASITKAAVSNPVVRRALVIGEADYSKIGPKNNLASSKYDANAVYTALKKSGYSKVVGKLNVNKGKIENLIESTFKGADDNDVSLFYFSGHGFNDPAGTLVMPNGNIITPSKLAKCLNKVNGTVVVIIDACFSGGVIKKGNADAMMQQFNDSVVNAFASADTSKTNVVSKAAGVLANSKFKVLTACREYETSDAYVNGDNSFGVSFFTYYMIQGSGFDYMDGSKRKSAPANYNGDKATSIYEICKYVNKKAEKGFMLGNKRKYPAQRAMCYPSNSGFKVFKSF